ncbi:hypothetical protein K440DRAFT_664947 [Wilcoxina mikolae CBS 423.85]|nr:hypothetical protein K440DRAFT_664947 [Wilcoxina mikolae CBS 423.85]
MHFSALLPFTFLLAFVVASPLEQNQGLEFTPDTDAELARYLEVAKQRGIDPYGPYPKDYIKHNGNSIDFKEDSDFAVWLNAQGARTDNHKRDSNLDITYVPLGPAGILED